MRALILLTMCAALLAGCASGESGTIDPEVRQMKPSSRGHKG